MKSECWCVRSRKIWGRMLRYLWVPKGRSICNGRRLGDLINISLSRLITVAVSAAGSFGGSRIFLQGVGHPEWKLPRTGSPVYVLRNSSAGHPREFVIPSWRDPRSSCVSSPT